jgi:hypothetical protein
VPGRYILNTQINSKAQSRDRMPPAFICVIDFHLWMQRCTENFYWANLFYLLKYFNSSLKLLTNWQRKFFQVSTSLDCQPLRSSFHLKCPF